MRGTALPGRFVTAGRCKRGRGSRYLYVDSAQRYYDNVADIREIKQQRYSDHDTEEGSANTWEQSYITRDRLNKRQKNDYSCEDNPELNGYRYSRSLGHCNLLKGRCHRSSTRRYVHPNDACYDGRLMERDEYKEKTYDRGDLDVSFHRSESRGVNNFPCKFFAEGYCKYGEDCSSSHQEPLGHSGDHKRGNIVKIGSCLSWKGPKWDDQRTTNEAPRSSRWRYDHGKESCYNTGSDNSLSRNSSPRRDGRRTTEDASKSFQCRSDDDNHDINVDTRNILSWNSPKWDQESKKEMETPNSLSPKGPNWGKQRKIIDSLNSARHSLDDGRLDSNGKSGRRFSRNGLKGDEAAATEATNSGKCGTNVKIASTSSWDGPKWGDQIASREAPNSSIWRSDDDKQDSDIKVDHGQSWNGPRVGDLTLTKVPNSSQSRSDADICSNGVRTNHISSCNDPKRGDQSTKETSGNGPEGKERRKNDLETPNSLPGNGTNWGTQRKVEGSLNFSPRRLGDDSRIYNAKSSRRFSRNDSKGSTQTTSKDATNSGKWGNNLRISNNSSWNGPKWGDQTTKETSWKGPKWGDQTLTETSWNGPKLGDQTTKETSWHGPRWGDETFEETPRNGPKWGDLRATKDADADKCFQESSDRRTKETSWNGPKWVNQTTKDTSRHSPAWGDKTTVEISLSGSNWGDLRTTKDADAHKSSQESSDRRTKETSWNGSNWGNQTTKESSRRSPTWGDKTTEETPKHGSKWGDLRTTKDVDAHKSSQESSYRRTKETSWNGPKWGDQTTKETSRHGPPWGDKTTSETRQNGSRWGDLRKAKDADAHKSSQESSAQRTKEKSWNGPKWGDQITTETSLHGPTWGDKTTEEAPRNGLKWGDLRTEWLKGGPKWGEQVGSHCSPVSSIQRTTEHDRQNHIMKHDNILPLDVSRDGGQTSAKDLPFSPQRRSVADKWGNVETDHNLSLGSQNHSVDTITKDASLTCQWRSDNDECHPCEETNNSLAQNGPKWSHQMASRDVSNSSMWRSDDAGSGASACDSIVIEVTRHEPSPLASNVREEKLPQGAFQESLFFQDQKPTQEDSGNDQNAMIISQPLSSIQDSNFCLRTQEVQDQQSIKLSEKGQTLFPPPHEDLSQGMVQSVALNAQDTIPQRTPSQQNLNSDLQNHQVLEKSNQLQHLSVTLKPHTAAATPFRTNLEYLSTELITADSIDLNRLPISFETKEPAIMDESLTAKKNLALAPALLSGQPDNATRKENTDMEETNFQGNQEQKQDVHARLMAGGDNERLNDEQGIRMLKFALVEFVKDILKPSWRDGHLSKEVHKIIVKKVIDKVTCTLQGPAIPRSQEHIDQYMSYSKTKLTNLVMGYLGMYLKK